MPSFFIVPSLISRHSDNIPYSPLLRLSHHPPNQNLQRCYSLNPYGLHAD